MLDVFKTDAAFRTASLTAAINILPIVPARLSALGIFRRVPITTVTALVENKNGILSLLPVKTRGAPATQAKRGGRKVRSFEVPHIPYNDTIEVADVMGIRAFGEEDATQALATLVNERMQVLKQDHEVTHEYHRIGAIQGVVLDADGVTQIVNCFTEFGVAEPTVDFDFTAGAQDMKTKAQEVIRKIATALSGAPYRYIHALCSDGFFDSFISHATVKGAFETYQEQRFSLVQQTSFEFGNILWENYNGAVGTQPFIPANTARFFPVGVPDMFLEINAPANFAEAVGTPGKPYYAKQRTLEFDTGIEIHTQSNPLMICTRPGALVKGF